MKKAYSVLIIEDHPLTSIAYKSALEKIRDSDKDLNFDPIRIVNNLDDAHESILEASQMKTRQMFFLDIQLPGSGNGNLLSGEDLGIEIRSLMPDSVIIVATMLTDKFRISNIIKSMDPDAFLIKNDLDSEVLLEAIKEVTHTPPYYSLSILTAIRQQINMGHMIDARDRKIIYELSNGYKTKDLPNLIPMSMAGIEKRKRVLKDIFGVKNLDDRALISAAKEKGFI